MSTPVKVYQEEMHSNLGFFANWLPADPIEVGAIGEIKGGRFRQAASLTDLKIGFDLSEESSPHPLKYQSTSGTDVLLGGAASAGEALLDAEVRIEFSQEGAFLFEATGVRQVQIQNRFEVASKVLKAYEKGKWQSNWYLVESTYFAEAATVLISQDKSAGLTLSSKANVPISSTSLADPNIELSVKSSRGRIFQIISGKEMRPLYSCLRLRDTWFASPKIVPVHGVGNPDKSIDSFQRASIDELLDQ